MSFILLLTLCSAGDVTKPALPKNPLLFNSMDHVQVEVDASPTNTRGLQIVTVRLKMKDKRPQSVHEMKLDLSTRDPMTKIHVIYPKRYLIHDTGPSYYAHEGETAIQAIIQRAPGDRSPVQGRVGFRASPPGY